MPANVIMHKGGEKVNEAMLRMLPTPPGTDTFQPIAHSRLLDLVRGEVAGRGLETSKEQFYVNRQGNHFFGIFDLAGRYDDYCNTIAFRNSHLKDFKASVALGCRVFICDNLAMSGEVVIGRKHTAHIERDLPRIVADGIAKLTVVAAQQEARIDHYKVAGLTRPDAEHALVRSLELGVLPASHAKKVWTTWQNDDRWGQGKTAWRFMNAITDNWSQTTNQLIGELMPRSRRLYNVLDEVSDFSPANDPITIEGEGEIVYEEAA
jgi:hypothetical protein